MMVSAAKADYVERSDIRDVLACMAQKVYHISGPLGSALKVKVLPVTGASITTTSLWP